MQDHAYIARNHSHYGTYIFGGLSAPPTIAHVDAALHGVGELLPEVREWLREQVLRKRNGTAANGPFVCRRPRFEDAAAAWAAREKQRHEGWHARRSQKPTVVNA